MMRPLIGLLTVLLWTTPAQAATFWTDTFENHLWTGSNGNPWDTSACASSSPDGCAPGPIISTDFAKFGTHSLKSVTPGTYIDRFFGTSTTELWTRYYIYLFNYVANQTAGMKIQYYATQNTLRSYPNFYAHIFPGNSVGIVAQGVWQNGVFTTTNYMANVGSGTLANGQWYCIEEHLKMSGPGQANGVIEAWKDGVQIISYPAIQLNGPNDINPAGCTILCNSSNTTMTYLRHYDHEPSQGARYIDDLTVGNTRIGCGGSPPPPDTTPPPVPNAPTSTSTTLPPTYTWTGVSALDLAGYKVYRKLEACAGPSTTTLIATLGNVLAYQDTTIPSGTAGICVQLTSYDTSNNESSKSGSLDLAFSTGPATFAHIGQVVPDTLGANLTFTGLAFKIRFWDDFIARAAAFEITGLNGVTTYRHNRVWGFGITFACYEAQGSDGVWETSTDPNSFVCGTVPQDTVAPLPPDGIQVR